MNKSAFLRRGVGLSLAVAAFVTCTPVNTLPGTDEGTFAVVGTIETNTCGSGINAENPWDFTVFLSEDGSTLYMEDTDGTDELSGALSSVTSTMTSTVTANADATEAGAGTCDLTTTTSMTVTLSSATAPSSFKASGTYTYAAATGVSATNDCTDELASSGGPYSTLPCTVTYSFTATKQ